MAMDALPSWSVPNCVDPNAALAALAPTLQAWFSRQVGTPTAAQCAAWPTIAAGHHLLLCSSTGTGKTLAAFAPIFSSLLHDPSAPTSLRCLYVAPLKALCQDSRRTLRGHLRTLRHFHAGAAALRVGSRTGDTPARARRHQLDAPPAILLTTPESLATLLTHARGLDLCRSLRWVIVDEVHAFASAKRGADLALALERLAEVAEFQRIGLSATCTPVDLAARYLVGEGRPCAIAQVTDRSPLELTVEHLPPANEGFMQRLVARIARELREGSTTLVFTNTRRLAERVTWALRRRYPQQREAIVPHHSALSAVRRRQVERRLKHGKLWVAVTSSSLELGIDVGQVDQVIFVHPPGAVVRLLQRVGRAGHRPAAPKRGVVLAETPHELLSATETAASARAGQIEQLRLAEKPADVLCQHLLGMAMTQAWSADAAYALVRRAAPYATLGRAEFDEALDYLLGQRADGTSWLPPRLRLNADGDFAIVSDRTTRLLRRNLGTILTESSCAIRLQTADHANADELEAPRPIDLGEIDAIYAEQLNPGDRFLLDGRCLEVKQKRADELTVEEVLGRPQVPVWRGAGPPMPNELAERLFYFRVLAAETLRDGPQALAALLADDYALDPQASRTLAAWLHAQEAASEIPDGLGLLIEHIDMQSCGEFYLHTPLPHPANEALARVLALRWQRRFGGMPVASAADLGLVLCVDAHAPADPRLWREMLSPTGFHEDLQRVLFETDLLRAAFGRVAQVGLMVLRQPLGRKLKVGGRTWAERELFDQLQAFEPNFLLLRQAAQEAATLECDGASATQFLLQISKLPLRLRLLREPSPFGEGFLQLGSPTVSLVAPGAP